MRVYHPLPARQRMVQVNCAGGAGALCYVDLYKEWYLSKQEAPVKTRTEWSDEEKAEVVERVLAEMAEGKTLTETTFKIGKALGRSLSHGMVRRWIVANEDYFQRYEKTKSMLGQAFAEEAIKVARESTTATTAMDRVLIDTLKWAAAKANPREYGEKQTVEHQGAPTLQVKIVEDDIPVRNPRAVGNAVATAMIAAPNLMLSAPESMPEEAQEVVVSEE